MRLVSACALWVALTAAALPVRGQHAAMAGEEHGWIAAKVPGGEVAALLHLPPRESVAPGSGPGVGVARRVQTLHQLPADLAWRERKLYLFYRSATGVDVFSLRAAPTSVPTLWGTSPAVGASAEPSLELDGAEFVDAACTGGVVAVLARDERWRLWVLSEAGWGEIGAPPALAAAGAGWVRLLEGAARPALAASSDAETALWERADGAWSSQPLAAPSGWGEASILGCFASRGDVCLVVKGRPAGVEAWSLGPRLAARLAAVGEHGSAVGVSPLGGGARFALLSLLRNESAERIREPVEEWELVEVSLATGRELYRGPPRTGAPVTGEDLRWLSLGVVALTVAILFYMLRPGADADAVVLPEGVALAEPGRRLAAGLLDAVLVGLVVSATTGVPLQHVLLVAPLLGSAQGVAALVLFVGLGAVQGTLGEWLWGRTIGKSLAGCRVVSVAPGRPKLGLMRSGARNVFKWVLAPWAAFGLASPELRHRGDRVAGAAVVVAVEAGEHDDAGEPPER